MTEFIENLIYVNCEENVNTEMNISMFIGVIGKWFNVIYIENKKLTLLSKNRQFGEGSVLSVVFSPLLSSVSANLVVSLCKASYVF